MNFTSLCDQRVGTRADDARTLMAKSVGQPLQCDLQIPGAFGERG